MSITAEKKQHTLKNTVMALPDKFIIFLGRTFSGHNHDYLMLKQEFPPEVRVWLEEMKKLIDTPTRDNDEQIKQICSFLLNTERGAPSLKPLFNYILEMVNNTHVAHRNEQIQKIDEVFNFLLSQE